MKYVYLTVDVEEWYDLDYLKDFNLAQTGIEVIPSIYSFLDLLDELNIKATFFILASLAEKHADIIQELVNRGHAIGCHGLDHALLYSKENTDFFNEIKQAKEIIQNVANCEVDGYRAACFSMEIDKLELVREAGYKYDSSKIFFEQHPLYRNLDMSGFEKVDDLIYRNKDFFEYEIPTIQIGKFSIPISGGGYLRLFPLWMIKLLIKKYDKNEKSNFLIYIHPFELTSIPLPLPKELSLMNKFRFSIGRKNNLKKLRKILVFLKCMDVQFKTLSEQRENILLSKNYKLRHTSRR